MSEIKSCPFCGGTPQLKGREFIFVRCLNCRSRGKEFYRGEREGQEGWNWNVGTAEAQEGALAFWNTRLGLQE